MLIRQGKSMNALWPLAYYLSDIKRILEITLPPAIEDLIASYRIGNFFADYTFGVVKLSEHSPGPSYRTHQLINYFVMPGNTRGFLCLLFTKAKAAVQSFYTTTKHHS
jgi:hypothetical protein